MALISGYTNWGYCSKYCPPINEEDTEIPVPLVIPSQEEIEIPIPIPRQEEILVPFVNPPKTSNSNKTTSE